MTWRFNQSLYAGPENPAAGFTLIEMIVVLVILSVMTTLILSSRHDVSPAVRARAAAQAISGALRAARSEAVMSNQSIFFTVDTAMRGYQWGGTPQNTLSSDLQLSLLTSDQLVSGTVGRIRFDPDGGSSGGRISISNVDQTWWVGVDWLTGRVSIEEKSH